jgi:hypothetical protein
MDHGIFLDAVEDLKVPRDLDKFSLLIPNLVNILNFLVNLQKKQIWWIDVRNVKKPGLKELNK